MADNLTAEEKYGDIIDLPCPTSQSHPRMTMVNRAAQFSPFAALTGYDDEVEEKARLTEEKHELTEDEEDYLNKAMISLREKLSEGPQVTLVYFSPDEKKSGGKYISFTGTLRHIDDSAKQLVFTSGERIDIENIIEIKSE
ncbi:MAG: hypothetical protein ACI4KD_07690 [Oscillospiraceae bacterium]